MSDSATEPIWFTSASSKYLQLNRSIFIFQLFVFTLLISPCRSQNSLSEPLTAFTVIPTYSPERSMDAQTVISFLSSVLCVGRRDIFISRLFQTQGCIRQMGTDVWAVRSRLTVPPSLWRPSSVIRGWRAESVHNAMQTCTNQEMIVQSYRPSFEVYTAYIGLKTGRGIRPACRNSIWDWRHKADAQNPGLREG